MREEGSAKPLPVAIRGGGAGGGWQGRGSENRPLRASREREVAASGDLVGMRSGSFWGAARRT
jgi:hypothetical protein